MSARVSDTEVARWALDASDWLWGTVQGAWNEKQSTSQVIVDAVIGMIPLVGDVTAARDLIAVSTRLASDPAKREDTMEWVLLVVLVFALIPVIGGVIKGVGRLLIKGIREGADNAQVLKDIVEFCNRIGHGNAVAWVRQLHIAGYQAQVLAKFNELMDLLVQALTRMRDRLGWFASDGMRRACTEWIDNFQALKAQGARMIPRAIRELDAWMRQVQRAVYQGQWHTVTPGVRHITREAEAALIENAPRKLPRQRSGHPANAFEDYQHVQGWPDLRKGAKRDPDSKKYFSETIAAFSGPMRAVELKPGQTIYRVLLPSQNGKASPWWLEKLPETAQEWRELLAVLDKFNKNNFFIKYTIPEGTTLKAWRGQAAEQFHGRVGQYLPGGGTQLFVDFPAHIKAEVLELPALSTGWGKTTKRYGYGPQADAAIGEIELERLAANEVRTKMTGTGP
jgi:hypothetical protein